MVYGMDVPIFLIHHLKDIRTFWVILIKTIIHICV